MGRGDTAFSCGHVGFEEPLRHQRERICYSGLAPGSASVRGCWCFEMKSFLNCPLEVTSMIQTGKIPACDDFKTSVHIVEVVLCT